jgi:hypothetical protein
MIVAVPCVASLLAVSLGVAHSPLAVGELQAGHESQLLIAKSKGKHSKGGGGHHPGLNSGGRTGFKHAAPSFDRGNVKPIGGWRDGNVRATNHGLQSDWQRAGDRWDHQRDRSFRKPDNNWERVGDRWDRHLDRVGDRFDNRVDRLDRRLDRWDDWGGRWPGWARRGWGVARPWNYGWYSNRNYNQQWGWWGARAAAWGIGSLATASIINNAVDDAIDAQRTTIIVPDSSYQLIYGSVAPTNDQSLSFTAVRGDSDVAFTADCRSGDLNGKAPGSVAEAQLLNAACQIAFGNG